MDRTYVMESELIDFHISQDDAPDPEKFERHCHTGYELIFVTKGSGRYVVDSGSYPLKANTLFLFRPGEYHCVEVARKAPYERYVIHFAPEAVSEEVRPLLRELDLKAGGGSFTDRGQVPLVANAIFSLLGAVKQMPPAEGELLARLVLSEILVVLSVTVPRRAEENEPLGKRAQRYIDEHLTEKIVLEDVARHFFVSKYYVCRAFRAHTGMSVLQYITERRVYLARQRIEQGQTAVSAAMEAGFGDYSSFYRAHLRVLGAPPTAKHLPGGDGTPA
jgi:AraC-like DNA-binding protein